MRTAPCKNCEKKGCGAYHDICPEYVQWKGERIQTSRSMKKEKKVNSAIVELSARKAGTKLGEW